MYTLDEDVKMLRELGLSTIFLAGLFVSIFASSAAITSEIESGTITTVLSKPVGRLTFILGKFLGIAAAAALAMYILSIAYMLMVRHGVLESASDTHDWTVIISATLALSMSILIAAMLNYLSDLNFCSTLAITTAALATIVIAFLYFFDREMKFAPQNNGFTLFDLYGCILLLFAVVLLIALAVMFSTRFNIVLTLIGCVAVFLVGLISDYLFGRFADTHLWAKVGKIAFPNLQVFWISDAIYTNSTIQPFYLLLAGAYAMLYTAGILLLATAMFERKQLT
jgi:hypothetical protein